MSKELTITLDESVFEELRRFVGSDEVGCCVKFIEELVRERVVPPYTVEQLTEYYRLRGVEPEEAGARAYLKYIYLSGELDLVRKIGDQPQWVEAAYQAMQAGDAWDGSALAILDLSDQEMAADEEREAEAMAWETMNGKYLPYDEEYDGPR